MLDDLTNICGRSMSFRPRQQVETGDIGREADQTETMDHLGLRVSTLAPPRRLIVLKARPEVSHFACQEPIKTLSILLNRTQQLNVAMFETQ